MSTTRGSVRSLEDRNPFIVLEIGPDSGLDAVHAAYRARAREHHPDVAGPRSTTRMAEINWAYTELQRDLAGWRAGTRNSATGGELVPWRKDGLDSGSSGTRDVALGWVAVKPQVVILSGVAGASEVFAATARGVAASDLRARVPATSPIELSRERETKDTVWFRATISGPLTFEGEDALIVPITLLAPGYWSNQAFVSIQPMSESVVSQAYPKDRIAPARHPGVTQRLSFGKHKGRTFEDVALEERGYLEWMIGEGAGSKIERECAALALGRKPESVLTPPRIPTRESAAARSISASDRRTPPALPARRSPARRSTAARSVSAPSRNTPPTLPDGRGDQGILGAIKRLLRG